MWGLGVVSSRGGGVFDAEVCDEFGWVGRVEGEGFVLVASDLVA
jgi:hypothetical protein